MKEFVNDEVEGRGAMDVGSATGGRDERRNEGPGDFVVLLSLLEQTFAALREADEPCRSGFNLLNLGVSLAGSHCGGGGVCRRRLHRWSEGKNWEEKIHDGLRRGWR